MSSNPSNTIGARRGVAVGADGKDGVALADQGAATNPQGLLASELDRAREHHHAPLEVKLVGGRVHGGSREY